MTIKTFEPQNTKDKLYIRANYSSVSLGDFLQQIHSHFGLDGDALNLTNAPFNVLDQFEISAEHIHTDCIGYDRYDPGDHTNFIVVERVS